MSDALISVAQWAAMRLWATCYGFGTNANLMDARTYYILASGRRAR